MEPSQGTSETTVGSRETSQYEASFLEPQKPDRETQGHADQELSSRWVAGEKILIQGS